MRKKTMIFLVAAIAALFISGCCCKDKGQEFSIIQFASSKDSNYIFSGRQYLVLLYKQGEDWHEVGVPFGDFFGDTHTSKMKFWEYSLAEPYSEKYGVAGVLKREDAAVEAFLPTLQKHLRNNDADAISKMIIYPIHIGDRWFENRHEFLKYYPRIFTEEKKQELLELQNKDMLCNYKGLMFSYGLWFSPIDDKAYFDVLHLLIY